MTLYTVQLGDSPAKIAISKVGCPKCAIDLVHANPQKEAVTFPNGFKTFRSLRAGERLNLPRKWEDGTLDRMSRAYFDSLPHPDGVTRRHNDVSGALGDAASDAVTALAQLDNRTFSTAVGAATALIDQSVSVAESSANPAIVAYAQATHMAASSAEQHNQDLIRALDRGDQASAAQARLAVQNDLLTAIDTAGLAMKYGGATQAPAPDPGGVIVDIGQATILPTIDAVARAAAAAITADPNFCSNVAQAGSAVNTAVHAFKTAWNAANPGNPVPINTGTYDQATAAVLTQVLGSAPPACVPRTAAPLPSSTTIPLPGITPPQPQPPSSGIGLGGILGLSALGAGAVGGAIYYVTKAKRPRVRRVSSEDFS